MTPGTRIVIEDPSASAGIVTFFKLHTGRWTFERPQTGTVELLDDFPAVVARLLLLEAEAR